MYKYLIVTGKPPPTTKRVLFTPEKSPVFHYDRKGVLVIGVGTSGRERNLGDTFTYNWKSSLSNATWALLDGELSDYRKSSIQWFWERTKISWCLTTIVPTVQTMIWLREQLGRFRRQSRIVNLSRSSLQCMQEIRGRKYERREVSTNFFALWGHRNAEEGPSSGVQSCIWYQWPRTAIFVGVAEVYGKLPKRKVMSPIDLQMSEVALIFE